MIAEEQRSGCQDLSNGMTSNPAYQQHNLEHMIGDAAQLAIEALLQCVKCSQSQYLCTVMEHNVIAEPHKKRQGSPNIFRHSR